MLSKWRKLWALDPSRRGQLFYFIILRLKTTILSRYRLRGCGQKNIIDRPLFWTPEYITLGNECHIWPGCRIEGVSSWGATTYSPHLVFGDKVHVQQNCHITAASTLNIGSNVNILTGVVITDIDHDYSNLKVNINLQPLHVSETHIGDSCLIGAGAILLAGTKLGANCVVGANAVVRGCYPQGSVIAGNPARIIKRYDSESQKWI